MSEGVGYRPLLPRPSETYRDGEQQNNRNNIQWAFDRKLNRNEAAVFGGVPHSIFRNTSGSFVLPINTWTPIIGLGVIGDTNNSMLIDGGNGEFSTLLLATLKIDAVINVTNATATACTFAVGLYKNGVLVNPYSSYYMAPSSSNTFNTSLVQVDAMPGEVYKVAIFTNCTAPITLAANAITFTVSTVTSLERLREF